MKCKHCAADIAEGLSLCGQCGASQNVPGPRRCRRCGARIPHGAAICPQCGSRPGGSRRWLALVASVLLGVALGVAVVLVFKSRMPEVRLTLGEYLIRASGASFGR
jgi:RNA polymerase subunit RPABC4/transcription elongation factor Spt4